MRSARLVIPGLPHHVVQRAARGKALFFTDQDRRRYLDLLAEYATHQRLQIWAYCLMPDHVHLVAVPGDALSLSAALIPLQTQYSRHIHRTRKKKGILWHDRYARAKLEPRGPGTRCGVSSFRGRQGRDVGPWGADGRQGIQGLRLAQWLEESRYTPVQKMATWSATSPMRPS